MKPDATGVFTDTANYEALIPECTNISVGYYKQHTGSEMQDYAFASRLLKALIMADWSKLVIERDPAKEKEYFGKWSDYTWRDNEPKDAMLEYVLDYPEAVARFLKHHGVLESELDAF